MSRCRSSLIGFVRALFGRGSWLGAGVIDSLNDDTKDRGRRRVEILTGVERRRRWSAEDKGRIVAEAFAPDANASAVARRWDVCPQLVFQWRRDMRAGLLRPSPADALPMPGLVPIVMRSSAAVLEIELCGAVVRVPSGDGDLLAAVLRAVRASATA